MQKIYIMKRVLIAFTLLALCGSCSDSFLEDKKDYAGFYDEIYTNYLTAQAKVDYIYYLCLPPANTAGASETEELPGSTLYTQLSELTNNNVPELFYVNATSGPWLKIRECNIFLINIDKSPLTDDEKAKLKGQALFWRAWNYFEIVKMYGGVPIVLVPQNPILGDGDISQSELAVQRNSTADCITQICEDLDNAKNLLPGAWDNANWGRINAGAAAALKGRVLLTYASPLFNREDDKQRWLNAYNANVEAKSLLEANGFGLADGGGNRAQNWEKMLVTIQTKEFVMGRLSNTLTTDLKSNNGWEQSARPKDLLGNGGASATSEMLDMFPMADGQKPGKSTKYPYDPLKFYKNRDPRFYRTFAFNGVVWPYSGDKNYTVWSYQWYKDQAAVNSGKEGSGFAEYSGHVASGVYVRKRTNPNANYDATNKFALSATPYMEIRFAEVILNLAESAVGCDKLGEGYEGLFKIRARVGIPQGDGNYGVPQSLDRYGLFREILFERQIEFAYEGKRFQDMRRWMLYMDDASDKNNTCQLLGVEPFNGSRHHGIFLAVKPSIYSSTKAGIDNDVFNPASKSYNPNLVTRDGIALNPDASDADFNKQIEKLDKFYDTNLERVVNDILDPTNPKFEVSYRTKYNFLGLKLNVMKQSPYLFQTKGWDDYYGGAGTFDPLK